MAVLVNGSATMDERMVLRKADEIFYQYVGSDIYAPITHRIHPDDVRKFTDAINELKSGQLTETYVSVRLKEITDNFSWATIKLSWEPFALDGKPLFHLELSSKAISEQSTTNIQSTTHQYEVLLGLLGGMLLSYSSDTDIFEIFTICNEQKLHSYRGTLTEWENNFLKNHLDPDSIPDFQAFCLNLHEGQKRFKHNILTNAFSKNAAMELCSFQCQTIRDKKNNSYKVLGCITLFGKGKHRMPEAEYGLDTSMPILNKKL